MKSSQEMWTAPRLTGALRAFGNVSADQGTTHDARLGKDLVDRKALALQEQSKSCVSWAMVSDTVRTSADAGKAEVEETLKQLSASAKAIGWYFSFMDLCVLLEKQYCNQCSESTYRRVRNQV